MALPKALSKKQGAVPPAVAAQEGGTPLEATPLRHRWTSDQPEPPPPLEGAELAAMQTRFHAQVGHLMQCSHTSYCVVLFQRAQPLECWQSVSMLGRAA